MQRDEIDIFIDNILKEKNLVGVTDEVRVQLGQDLRENLLELINQALIEAIPDESLPEFNALLDKDTTTETEIQAFIISKGVDVQGVTLDTMLRFAELYLGNASKQD